MKQRIGVYICHCGGNISDYVDVEKVRQSVENINGVHISKTTMFACADSNQKDMVADILEHKLDGVVVAACSPKLHLLTFRAVVERARMNKYNFVHANIREQVYGMPRRNSGSTPNMQTALRCLSQAAIRMLPSAANGSVKTDGFG